jgi:putative oxidoreductase
MISKPVYHVGRILLAALFLTAGILKVTSFAGTVQYFSALGFPLPEAATALAILVEVGGGLTLLLGTRFARQAALLLAVFTVAASLSAHQFWQHGEEFIPFLKNMALVGALLLFWNNRQTANNLAN